MIMDLNVILQAILVIITVCGAIYGVMKFLLKDVIAQLTSIDRHIVEIKDDQKKMDQRVTETNKRMDGVYHILLKRTEKNV